MRYILLVLLFISGTASAQVGVKVGATRSQDTTFTIGPFRAQGQVRLVNYGTSDTNAVAGWDANGNLVRRTKSTGGGGSTDSSVFETIYRSDTGKLRLTTAINTKQNALGYTPENVANKATNFNTINDVLYPTTAATNTLVNTEVGAALDSVNLRKRANDSVAGNGYATNRRVDRKDDSIAALIPSVTGFVPYTGATSNVNLAGYSLTTNRLNSDTLQAKSSMGIHVHGTGGQGIMVGAGGGGNITFDAYPTTVPGDSVLTTNSSGGLQNFNLKTKLATYLLRSDTTGLLLTTFAASQSYTPLSTHNSQSGTTYTLQVSDLGKVVSFSNGSPIALTVPSGLGAGFYCTIQQMGAGQVTATGSGATLLNRQSHTKTKGQYAEFSIIFTPTANTYVTQGDME